MSFKTSSILLIVLFSAPPFNTLFLFVFFDFGGSELSSVFSFWV
jgi:hypothetical protein